MTNGFMKVLYRVFAFLIYLVPMLVLFLVRIEKYTQTAGALSFFGFVIIIFIVLFFKNQLLDFSKKDVLLTFSIALLVISVVTRYVFTEMLWIASTSVVGSVLSRLVNVVADVYANYEYKIIDGIKKKNLDRAQTAKQAWREAYGFTSD